ncbi:ankyrin repeat family protein [Orientia tsutsugamushi str. TA716]|uniref:Ankyrin repeat family protein n=1 Tax=Orientia tsutsugamushi str. TA716 TaxID=1359175 RepID=A0A0F3P5I7_ORITS|nr:ankyrin repeat family protein [Orientia tsutsugamushi str. TA716]
MNKTESKSLLDVYKFQKYILENNVNAAINILEMEKAEEEKLDNTKYKHDSNVVIHDIKQLCELKIDIYFHNTKQVNKEIIISESSGVSAIHIAASKNCIEIMERILAVPDIDIGIKDRNGNNALHIAVMHNHIEIVDKILNFININVNKKNILNAKNNQGNTPIHIAARYDINDSMKSLLSNDGIDVNEIDTYYGQTPLICAAYKGNKKSVELLLKQDKIDIDKKDIFEKSAIDWAKIQNYKEIEIIISGPVQESGDDIKAIGASEETNCS